MKHRLTIATIVPLTLLLLSAGSAVAQEPDDSPQSDNLRVFLTARGGEPISEWDAETLVRRITDGSVRVDEVRNDADDVVGIYPTRDIVIAAQTIKAGEVIDTEALTLRAVPIDDTNATAFADRADVEG